MSLLDNGPHSVTVYPQVKVPQVNNSVVYVDGPPVVVSGLRIAPANAEERQVLGVQPGTTAVIRGRGPWPGGIHSQVQWRGRRWDQVGEVEVFDAGLTGRTHHIQVTIRARSAEAR